MECPVIAVLLIVAYYAVGLRVGRWMLVDSLEPAEAEYRDRFIDGMLIVLFALIWPVTLLAYFVTRERT